MSLCEDCIRGVRLEGTPTGKFETIGGIECYVATPEGEYPKDKTILFLTDVLGLSLINSQLLVDDFARNGFKTIAPDIYNGEPIAESNIIGEGWHPSFNLMEWLGRHGQKQTRPTIDKVVAALKEQGITTFGATGYCFGARYVFDLAFENITKVSVVAHPSLLEVPDDLERYAQESKAPLLINACEFDYLFTTEAQASADERLGRGKFAPGFKQISWDGCRHGFAIRGDMSDPKARAGKEGSFKESVQWFIKNL